MITKVLIISTCDLISIWNSQNLTKSFVNLYVGQTCSSIGEEKKYNPRLTKSLNEFANIMSNLNLAYPKMLDKAVPANKVCGLYNLPEEFQEKLKETNANLKPPAAEEVKEVKGPVEIKN